MTFFENTPTPKSMADCVAIDSTAGHLFRWSKILKVIAKIIFALFAGVGIFLLLISLIVLFDSDEMAGIIAITAGSIVVSGLIGYCVLWAFATLIQALACLVQNSKVSAMVAVYQTGEELPKMKSTVPVSTPTQDPPRSHVGGQPIYVAQQNQANGTWVCPVCCRKNPASKTVCFCDYVRTADDAIAEPHNATTKVPKSNTINDTLIDELPDEAWQCPACGLILPKTQGNCSCGYKK